MINPIKGVHRWNKEAGLLNKPENRFLESSMLLEEVFEGMGFDDAKIRARKFVQEAYDSGELSPVTEVEWLDHLCDLEFILHGSKAKQRLSPQQDVASLLAVLEANMTKLSVGVDEQGKQMKPSSWVGPETELQKILDERI